MDHDTPVAVRFEERKSSTNELRFLYSFTKNHVLSLSRRRYYTYLCYQKPGYWCTAKHNGPSIDRSSAVLVTGEVGVSEDVEILVTHAFIGNAICAGALEALKNT